MCKWKICAEQCDSKNIYHRTERELKKTAPEPQFPDGRHKSTPQSRADLVITCTFTDRWVASSSLYRFQHPAADCSREACEPRTDPASRITKCGLKKDLSRTPQGTASQAPHPSQSPCCDFSVVPLLCLLPSRPAALGSGGRNFKFAPSFS